MFGYDSKVTKYSAGAISENSVFSHAKDLLFSLCRERALHRPLICVAHSLGGIIVKEMLSRSSSSAESEYQNITESIAAVIFLGTPHRGSVDIAAIGELVRSLVSGFGMATTPVILDSLGLKNTDLERAQEDFSRLWQSYDFKVKTFQEGLSLTKLGRKVVPEYSSLIGNDREHAETLQADHVQMCRYSGREDPNYRKVAGEICSIYYSIVGLSQSESLITREIPIRNQSTRTVLRSQNLENDYEGQCNKACLQSLWFPGINSRYESLEGPAAQTCQWLFEHESYQDWLTGRNRGKYQGLLWLKGKPGSGKSTLMKEALRQATLGQAKAYFSEQIAGFFFNGKGNGLEHSVSGLFRSLLYQLLHKDPSSLHDFRGYWDEKLNLGASLTSDPPSWTESELKAAFESVIMRQTRRKISIIDAVDECDSNRVRDVTYFWRKITKSAYAARIDLNVCLSSRHFPSVTISDCAEIIMEQCNSHDIATYLLQRFEVGTASQEVQWAILKDKIMEMSAGVFLWVVLVVDDLLQSWDEGRSIAYLTKRVERVPQGLEKLFSQMFSKLSNETRETTVKLFQWATLSTKPLRLHEWHHIIGFIQQPTPTSLAEWRASDHFTATDDQLEKQIKTISLGLVEVTKERVVPLRDTDFEAMSVDAGAGSLDLEAGDSRVVQVIHESVRDFFLKGKGFSVLDPSLITHPVGKGHLSIMATCLDYVKIEELDALVGVRQQVSQQERGQKAMESPIPSAESNTVFSTISRSVEEETNHTRDWMAFQSRAQSALEGDEGRELPESTPAMDVGQWLSNTTHFTAQSSHTRVATHDSVTGSSDTNQSQILEDYPALLSYATFAMFGHALLAHDDGVDPTRIIDRFSDQDIWARWRTLREDVPQHIDFLDYLMAMGLSSWVNLLSNEVNHSHEQHQDTLESPLSSMPNALSVAARPAENPLPRNADTEISQLTQESARIPSAQEFADRPDSSSRRGSYSAALPEIEDWNHRSSTEDILQPRRALRSLKRGRSPSIISRRQSPTIPSHSVPTGNNTSRGTSPQSFSLMPRRRESVASFSSASSHDNQELYPRTLKLMPQVDQKAPQMSPDGTKVAGFFMCKCCPKKTGRFATLSDLK
ncbi:hypothetical protein NW762_012476 [Fusarium torreyae]|uniref:Orc1-like AAA ATPase domain-containing protein n=1 Tax=Fusarium torreyae TaxID=1237075 RepID=A0A9W8RQ71_9HYPO|nr:hypothetical protein NW762_012476 [Fusarium torreyae]